MARPGGWDNLCWNHLYFDADSFVLPCSLLVLNARLYDILAGNVAAPVDYFAGVTYGVGAAVLPNVAQINIDRSIEGLTGSCRIEFLTDSQSSATLIKGATISVVVGIRSCGFTASQQIFTGRIDQVTWPTTGKIRASLMAYDAGRALADASCNAGTVSGDVVTWITNRCAELSLGDGFQVVPRTAGISLPNSHYLSYTSFGDAIKAVTRAFRVHHAYVTGLNELVILDPTTLAAEAPLFSMSPAGVRDFIPVDQAQRFNRIPFSNYTGYSKNFVTYQLALQPDGSSTIQGVEVSGNGFIGGVWDDAADQAVRGVQLHPGIQNNICATEAELRAYCASVSVESYRPVTRAPVACNPFVDLGAVISFAGASRFVAAIKHRIVAGQLWSTELELSDAA